MMNMGNALHGIEDYFSHALPGSKDSPDYPAFQTSRALAVHTDKVIGEAMREAWNNTDKDAAVASVLPLVDQYLAHPSTNRPLWQPSLEAVLTAHAPK